jgi:hypothetical protein
MVIARTRYDRLTSREATSLSLSRISTLIFCSPRMPSSPEIFLVGGRRA